MIYSKEVQEHIDASLAEIRAIFEKAANKIEAIKPGEKIPATELATQIAEEYKMTCPQLYPTLKFLLNSKYPGVDIRRGAHGGIFKLLPVKVGEAK
jgi:hypothetical protein